MSSNSSSIERASLSETFLAALRRPHEAFAASRRFTHVRRTPYLQQLYKHVSSNQTPLVVCAPSGAGKSALLAYWIAEYRKQNPNIFVVEHYIGCAEGTAASHEVIRHIMLEIKERYNLPQEIPETPAELVHEFPAWLWYIQEHSVLIIDGMNQLEGRETNGNWIPEKIPEKCTFILSTSDNHFHTLQTEREWRLLKIAPLTLAERRGVVQQFVRERKIGPEHQGLKRIAEDHFSSNPLLLRVRLEEAYRISEKALDDSVIASYLSASSIEDLYSQLLNRLQEQFGKDLVAHTFGLISAARHPLSETELTELLGRPASLPALLERLKFHISDGRNFLRYYHNSFRNVADAQFLATSETQRRIRTQLMEFFLHASPSSRCSLEVAGQLALLEEWDELGSYITRGENLLLLYQPQSTSQYLQHWHLTEMYGQSNLAELLVESLEKFKEANTNREQTAEALEAGGDVCRLTGATEVAARLYEAMLAEVQGSTPNTTLLARAHSRLGTVKELLGSPQEAETALKQALSFAEESADDEFLTATIRGNIGNMLYRQGKFSEALEMHRINLQATEKAEDISSTARVLNNIGSTYQRLGNQEKAMECFQRAREIAEATGNMVLHAHVAGNMAAIQSERGNLKEALKLCQEQRKAAEQIGRRRFVANSHITAANIYLKQGNHTQALEHYQHCKTIAEQASIPHMQGVALDGIGRCFIRQKDTERAEEFLHAALELFRASEDPHRVGSTEEALSTLAYEQGKYHTALEGYRNAFTTFQKMGLRRTLLETRQEIGRTLLRLGQPTEAEQEFNLMLQEAQELSDTASIALAHFRKGCVEIERQNFSTALSYVGSGLNVLTIDSETALLPQPRILSLLVEGLRAALLRMTAEESEQDITDIEQNIIEQLVAYTASLTTLEPTVDLFVRIAQEALKPEPLVESFLDILSSAPNNSEAQAEASFIVARLFVQQGKHKEAKALFEETCQRYTNLLKEKPETELYRIRLRRVIPYLKTTESVKT